MTASLSHLLADYSPPQERNPTGIALLRRVKLEPKPAELPPEPKPDPIDHQAELIRRVETQARQDERQKAQEVLAQALAGERKRFEDELNTQRLIWVEQEGSQLSLQLGEAFSNLERVLSERVANVLASFVSEAVRHRMIDDFEAALKTLLSRSSGGLIRVAGPQDLLSIVESRMGPHREALKFVPNDDVEVAVVSQDTAIETQLSSWLSRLTEVSRAD